MKIGILADIHEDAQKLALALRRFRQQGVQQVVVLGDVVFEMGSCLHETIALLAGAGTVGVWGNHDLGLCHEPNERMKQRHAGPVPDFLRTLRPRLELGGRLFTHGLPYYDATDPIVYYLGERPETAEGLARSFAASDHSVLFVGHVVPLRGRAKVLAWGLKPWHRPVAVVVGVGVLSVLLAVLAPALRMSEIGEGVTGTTPRPSFHRLAPPPS